MADVLHRGAFSTDASIYRIWPVCVVAPRDGADVAAAVKYAAENNIPVAARGAGSGVAGESLGSGIVIDMTRYMNRILRTEDGGRRVVCEPGAVLSRVNERLAEFGRKIGPDPSSGNRATVGGCVANNATGAHSLQYGYIADYVESVEAVLADGSVAEFGNDVEAARAGGAAGEIARKCAAVLAGKEGVIKKAMPKTSRNRSGYNIAGVCRDGRIDMAKLMAGSEGTLAVFTKITLRTVELPKAKGLLQLEFDTLEKMAKAVPVIVGTGAAACELMDRSLMDMARDALPQYRDILPAGAAMVLLVEHVGNSQEEVRGKIETTDAAVGAAATGRRVFFGAVEQKRLWKSRTDAVPLLGRKKGAKHPLPFIEDVSVENTRLAEYVTGLERIAREHVIDMSFYGHAGDGELHIRPYLDLTKQGDIDEMLAVANEVFSLAWSLGGSISGEHADGLVRAAFLRRQYGDEFYELLCEIKSIFDPKDLMNPGKIINSDPDVMVRNLKAEKKALGERLASELLMGENELRFEIEQCSGCGVCLSREADLRMCPVYRALGEELASSRAKANLLHLWVTGQLTEKDFESAEFKKFLGMCVNCKACSLQCPSGVDISRLMCAARAEYARRVGMKATEKMLSHNRFLSMTGSVLGPVANFAMGLGFSAWALEKAAGLDARRRMPKFGFGSFIGKGRKYLAAIGAVSNPVDKAAYFVDTFANFNDHGLGFAVLGVLRHNDIEVILPEQLPAPLPAIVYGDVKRARKDLAYNVEHLGEAVRRGYKIVCSEPSAALCLKDELKYFVSGAEAEAVSANTYELMNYLLGLHRQNKLKKPEGVVPGDFSYHTPCHLFAIGDEKASIQLLKELCGVKITDLNAGCCGLAGTFGMQKKNYELSSQISAGLAETLKEREGEKVLTECAACAMQIEHISKCETVHPIKVLAAAYGLQ